jgi:hypothetical protein
MNGLRLFYLMPQASGGPSVLSCLPLHVLLWHPRIAPSCVFADHHAYPEPIVPIHWPAQALCYLQSRSNTHCLHTLMFGVASDTVMSSLYFYFTFHGSLHGWVSPYGSRLYWQTG